MLAAAAVMVWFSRDTISNVSPDAGSLRLEGCRARQGEGVGSQSFDAAAIERRSSAADGAAQTPARAGLLAASVNDRVAGRRADMARRDLELEYRSQLEPGRGAELGGGGGDFHQYRRDRSDVLRERHRR